MNLANWLVKSAFDYPQNRALFKGNICSADYLTFKNRSASIATYLKKERGVEPGDRVAIFMPNSSEYLEIMYAVWFLGAVVVPINAKLHSQEAMWIISDAEAKIIFVSENNIFSKEATTFLKNTYIIEVSSTYFQYLYGFSREVELAKVNDKDLVWLFYTSGTTGNPKGVMLSSGNLQAMTKAYLSDVDSVSSQDASLYAAPMSHGAGLYNIIFVKCGARHIIPLSDSFDPEEILALSGSFKNISMFAAPTMIKRLVAKAVEQKNSGDGMKTIVYGGGPMYLPDIVQAVNIMGPRFVQIFGQGECPMCISVLTKNQVADWNFKDWERVVGSVGKPQSGVNVSIRDDTGNELPLDEIGEIYVTGSPVMLGYWRNIAATKSALDSGWLKTGDLGRINVDGFITLEGRSKDVIISGGSNIYPIEVEAALLEHPDVYEVAVIGQSDSDWGEIVVAFVVGKISDIKTLDEICIKKIARFKRPKKYIFVQSLPKNNYGKVLKKNLTAQLNKF
jgi:long-chain acyl-CoA synthetase